MAVMFLGVQAFMGIQAFNGGISNLGINSKGTGDASESDFLFVFDLKDVYEGNLKGSDPMVEDLRSRGRH